MHKSYNYTFLKKITSPTYFISSIDVNGFVGLELDYRYEPRNLNLCYSDKVIQNIKPDLNIGKDFTLEYNKVTVEECIVNLSPNLLLEKRGVAKGIIDKQLKVDQVQHTYECHWSIFHFEKYDGRAEITVKELIELDPSTCYVIDIPCGYYAERESISDDWYIYKHEERIETDSSIIFKKAFLWNNTYRVINQLDNKNTNYYTDYYLDTRVIKKTSIIKDKNYFGFSRFYNEEGKLIKKINHDTGEEFNY